MDGGTGGRLTRQKRKERKNGALRKSDGRVVKTVTST